jgi:hypothetical protein
VGMSEGKMGSHFSLAHPHDHSMALSSGYQA